MALEIAAVAPPRSRLLDVGCGNGFIAYHLAALLGGAVLGIDVADATAAPIAYVRYDGQRFPLRDGSHDVVLLCYVLHHVRDCLALLSEAHRVLRAGGIAVLYEDIPARPWDRVMCWLHGQQWKRRAGASVFRSAAEWQRMVHAAGFSIVEQRALSRWRNLAYPVGHRLYVLRIANSP